MDAHTAIGARMLERIPFLAPVAPLVRSAHERFRRRRLPRRAGRRADPPRGDDHRHLRRLPRDDLGPLLPTAMPKQAAIRELEASAGTQFDAAVVAALIAELG